MKQCNDPRLRLVLVDDHEDARNALAKRLSGDALVMVRGHVADPNEALALIQHASPHVALVDPVRADGRGSEVISSLAALPEFRRPLVLVHLAFFDADIWEQARVAGASDVVLKLANIDALASQLLTSVGHLLPRDRWPAIMR